MAKKEKQVKEKPVKEKRVREKPAKKEKPVREKPAKKEKPVREKPEKKKPEKAEGKAGLLDKFKKNKNGENDGMDILTEAKEPFSLQGFFDEHVVEKWKRMKAAMEARGIWAFLTSPFQARGRLIAQLMILVLGIMFGVIPRASSMVSELQGQAYASEIAGLSSKTVGSITITPAASSNYKRMHMIAFVIDGKNLPSDPDKYEVHLARGYGASDWEDVTYSWTMYPVTDTRRIMLVAIDQSKQASGYGAFQLYIQLKDDPKVSKYAKESGYFEITLSSAQETTALYDKTGVHLSAITSNICGSGEIAKKQADFQEALNKYQVALEQAEAMPVGVTVSPTTEDLETYCLSKRVYRELKDDSNTEDILKIPQVNEAPELDYEVKLVSGGIEYNAERVQDLRASEFYSEEEEKILDEFDHVEEAKKAVLAAMENVNTEAMSWYNTLSSYKLILNQTIKTNQFPLYARTTETLEDDINYLDGSPEGPDTKGDNGPVADHKGDDEYPSKTPSETEEPTVTPEPSETEEPVVTPEPEEDDDGDEEPEETPDPEEDDGDEEPEDDGDGEETQKPTTKPYVPGHPASGDPADSK